jgi:hypothetical protein
MLIASYRSTQGTRRRTFVYMHVCIADFVMERFLTLWKHLLPSMVKHLIPSTAAAPAEERSSGSRRMPTSGGGLHRRGAGGGGPASGGEGARVRVRSGDSSSQCYYGPGSSRSARSSYWAARMGYGRRLASGTT